MPQGCLSRARCARHLLRCVRGRGAPSTMAVRLAPATSEVRGCVDGAVSRRGGRVDEWGGDARREERW